MRLLLITFSALAATATATAPQLAMHLRGPQGIDVSHWQGTIDWKKVKSQGVAFAYIKATEGTSKATFMKHDPLPHFAPVTVPESWV